MDVFNSVAWRCSVTSFYIVHHAGGGEVAGLRVSGAKVGSRLGNTCGFRRP
jgi:hypothetical protein